jgi:hypothetical protein
MPPNVDLGGIANEISGSFAFLARSFFVVIFVLVFSLVVLAFFVVFFVIRILDFGKFQCGERRRFTEQVAFSAHPQARDSVFAYFRHRHQMAAGLQNDNIAWFQIHDLFLG